MFYAGERTQEFGMSFTRHPQPLAAPLNDDVNFECSLNLIAERFAWHHRPLNTNKWIRLSHPFGGGKISRHVVNFNNESKAGDYRCVAFFGINLPSSIEKFIFYVHTFTKMTSFRYSLSKTSLRYKVCICIPSFLSSFRRYDRSSVRPSEIDARDDAKFLRQNRCLYSNSRG